MKKIILTKGLPASGKSTWAKELVSENPGEYKRINKDDLRAMFDAGHWSKDNERFLLEMRDLLTIEALKNGKHVIIDDTNFAPKHEARMREIAKANGATVEVKVFDVPLEECIKRDLKRLNSVGETVIRKMYVDYLEPKVEMLIQDRSLPAAIIVDIDGTLAKMNGRSPFEWQKVGSDLPNEPVVNAVQHLATEYKIIFLSGRDGCCRSITEEWINKHVLAPGYCQLFMRPENDMRKDSIIKRELFDAHIRGKYFVEFVLDDRNQVVDLWRKEIGIPCFQVDYGNF